MDAPVTDRLTDADQWELLIPHMKYMALLRNARNFDRAGVSLATRRKVGAYLADPENVAASKQFPMRFLSAYMSVENDVWHSYLSEALDHSLANVPEIPGNWLVLVDASGSMGAQFSDKSAMTYYGAATVFAAAFARRNRADIRTYSNDLSGMLPSRTGESTLQTVARLANRRDYWFGGGTYTAKCLRDAFNAGQYDRVLLLTDEQAGGGWWAWDGDPGASIPENVPLYTFNLAGYRAAHTASGMNRITVGGLSDAAFQMMASVEAARGGSWPWEA